MSLSYCMELIDYLINKKPNKHSILVAGNMDDIMWHLKTYLENKCIYTTQVKKIGKCFESEIILEIEIKWPS